MSRNTVAALAVALVVAIGIVVFFAIRLSASPEASVQGALPATAPTAGTPNPIPGSTPGSGSPPAPGGAAVPVVTRTGDGAASAGPGPLDGPAGAEAAQAGFSTANAPASELKNRVDRVAGLLEPDIAPTGTSWACQPGGTTCLVAVAAPSDATLGPLLEKLQREEPAPGEVKPVFFMKGMADAGNGTKSITIELRMPGTPPR